MCTDDVNSAPIIYFILFGLGQLCQIVWVYLSIKIQCICADNLVETSLNMNITINGLFNDKCILDGLLCQYYVLTCT